MAAERDRRLPEAVRRAAAQDGAPGTVIRHSDQHGFQQPALSRRGQPRPVEQEHHVGERRLLHESRDGVAADPDVRLVGVHDRRAPRLHERR
jgi:hypothetical protein